MRFPTHASRGSSVVTSLIVAAFAFVGCGPAASVSPAPKVTSTSPADLATTVALDAPVSAVFDLEMEPLSATTFTLLQGATPVTGAVSMSADGKTATFVPQALAAGTVYSAKLTTGVTSKAGVALATAHAWSFTTATSAVVVTVPEVTARSPLADALGVAINTRVAATFNVEMDPLTLTEATFTVKQGATVIPGAITMGPGPTAVFTSTGNLPVATLLTASLSVGVKSAAGTPLASAVTWQFTTGSTVALGPAAVNLGAAGRFVVLAKTGISSVPASVITGDLGLGPAAASYVTGFSLVADATNVFANATQVVGKVYAANYAVPTPSNLTTAVSNMEGAYTDAAGRPTPDFLELGTGNIGGKTLAPGLYKWTSTITVPTDVTIAGGANDVWIFQTSGDLITSAATRVTLAGGALAKNIFWQVAGKATLGVGSHFEGVLLCKTEVTLQTAATMNGRVLAQTQVALQQATLTQPAP